MAEEWDIWCENNHLPLPEREDEFATVTALDAEHAAEKFIQEDEAEDCDYPVANGEDAFVCVRPHGAGPEAWQRYRVTAVPEITYRAIAEEEG